MKILVLSDSHSALSFMFRCVRKVKPDAIIHLGDYFDDAQALQQQQAAGLVGGVVRHADGDVGQRGHGSDDQQCGHQRRDELANFHEMTSHGYYLTSKGKLTFFPGGSQV
mgnify:CR=1 FL=1